MTCRTEVMIQPISQQWAHIEEDYRINYISISFHRFIFALCGGIHGTGKLSALARQEDFHTS